MMDAGMPQCVCFSVLPPTARKQQKAAHGTWGNTTLSVQTTARGAILDIELMSTVGGLSTP